MKLNLECKPQYYCQHRYLCEGGVVWKVQMLTNKFSSLKHELAQNIAPTHPASKMLAKPKNIPCETCLTALLCLSRKKERQIPIEEAVEMTSSASGETVGNLGILHSVTRRICLANALLSWWENTEKNSQKEIVKDGKLPFAVAVGSVLSQRRRDIESKSNRI